MKHTMVTDAFRLLCAFVIDRVTSYPSGVSVFNLQLLAAGHVHDLAGHEIGAQQKKQRVGDCFRGTGAV